MKEDDANKAFGLKEGDGDARWWLGGLVTVKATGKQTDGHYALVEVLDPEGPQPLHVHHRYTVESGPARMLLVNTPPGLEDHNYATSEPAKELNLPPEPEGPPDEAEMEQLHTLCRRYGVEFPG